MLRSMYAGISGLKVNQTKLDVVGNNIANSGTTAFKGSRVRFQDMLSQNMSEAVGSGRLIGGSNPRQVGLGVQLAGIDTLMSQGVMQPTSRNLDVAVDGEGYFMVARADLEQLGAGIQIDPATHILPEDTQETTINYTRDGSFTLDDKGNLLTSDGYRVLGYEIGEIKYENDKNSVAFKDANKKDDVKTENKIKALVIPEDIEVAGKKSKVTSFSIEKDGVIKATLQDGKTAAIGQIAMSSFKNPAGLKKLGKNLYESTANSGQAVIRSGVGTDKDADNSKSYGDILQGMLEMSNVDLAEQFTDMIVATRAFQASGKMITTGDEILQDLVNLKR